MARSAPPTKKVIVIGAGPAGLTAAYEISKDANFEVHLFEAGPSVGGMAKTIRLWNQLVDIGPHRFFSSDPRVNRVWLEVLEGDYRMVDRLTRIFYRHKFYHYPLKAWNALANLGIIEAALCVLSYARYRLAPLRDESRFDHWVTNRFGKRLFKAFFKTYSEKLWGIPCSELDADFAAQRIKKFSLLEAIKSAFSGSSGGHKTLVDQFAYPNEGTGAVYTRMAERFVRQGGTLSLRCPVRRVLVAEDSVAYGIELDDGRIIEADEVISSMPLTTLVERLDGVPPAVVEANRKLGFRSTVLIYLRVDHPELFPDQWLYIHSDDLGVGRITNFRNWSPGLHGDERASILALEYWCDSEAEFFRRSDEELIAQARAEVERTGLNRGAGITDGSVLRIPKSYPVYARNYRQWLGIVEAHLRGIRGLTLVGRYGSFKYNNQDHSILMGWLAARNLTAGEKHDLWRVNSDDEYQESSRITATGLVVQNGP